METNIGVEIYQYWSRGLPILELRFTNVPLSKVNLDLTLKKRFMASN